MRTLNKILAGATLLSLAACSENATTATDVSPSLSMQEPSDRTLTECGSLCAEGEICADVCVPVPIAEEPGDTLNPPAVEEPLEIDVPGQCYSPCEGDPDGTECIALCLDHPKKIQHVLDSVARSYAAKTGGDALLNLFVNANAEYRFKTEGTRLDPYTSAFDIANNPELADSSRCNVTLYEQENGYVREYSKGMVIENLKNTVLLTEVRSLPIKVEMLRGYWLSDVGYEIAKNFELDCSKNYGSVYQYESGEGEYAAVCAMVDYEGTSVEQEAKKKLESCKNDYDFEVRVVYCKASPSANSEIACGGLVAPVCRVEYVKDENGALKTVEVCN